MQQLSNKIQTILAELNKFKRTQEAGIQFVEGSYCEKLEEIKDLRKILNASLDELENTTLKELDEIRSTLQTSLKKDVEKCNRLKDELQKLSEAVQGLCDKSKKDLEFIASRKCLDKIQESEIYLKENPVKVQNSIIFLANIDIELYLSKQSGLGRIVDSMQSITLKMNPSQILTVKMKSEYNVKISSDKKPTYNATGICCLPTCSGHYLNVIVADSHNKEVKLFNQSYDLSSQCDMSGSPCDVCQITSSEVAVTLNEAGVQFMSVSNGKLIKGRKLQFPHDAVGIAHHQGALYITDRTALYHYTLTGTLVKKLYEDKEGGNTVYKCALSPVGDRIYVTNNAEHKLLTLAMDGSLISTFTDPELQHPHGVHVTPAGQVLVCGWTSYTIIQVDPEGGKKLATLYSRRDLRGTPLSVCYDTKMRQIIVGVSELGNNKIVILELQ